MNTINLDTIQAWRDKLDNYDVSAVIAEMDAILSKAAPPKTGLKFEDIKVGETYRIIDQDGVKKSLRGAFVKVIQKKDSGTWNIVAELLTTRGRCKVGTNYGMHAAMLERA